MRRSLRAKSPIWASLAKTRERGAPRGFTACSRVIARLASFAQIGELARRLDETKKPPKTFKTTKLKHAMISKQINSFYDSYSYLKQVGFLRIAKSNYETILTYSETFGRWVPPYHKKINSTKFLLKTLRIIFI